MKQTQTHTLTHTHTQTHTHTHTHTQTHRTHTLSSLLSVCARTGVVHEAKHSHVGRLNPSEPRPRQLSTRHAHALRQCACPQQVAPTRQRADACVGQLIPAVARVCGVAWVQRSVGGGGRRVCNGGHSTARQATAHTGTRTPTAHALVTLWARLARDAGAGVVARLEEAGEVGVVIACSEGRDRGCSNELPTHTNASKAGRWRRATHTETHRHRHTHAHAHAHTQTHTCTHTHLRTRRHTQRQTVLHSLPGEAGGAVARRREAAAQSLLSSRTRITRHTHARRRATTANL